MIWAAVRLWFSSIPRTVFVCFGLGVGLLALAGYIYHAGRKSEANENATSTLERAVEGNKPVSDPERADVLRKYERDN